MDMGWWHAPGSPWWGPRGRRHMRHARRRLRRGILKFVLLKFLAETPRHGYELIRAFRVRGWGAGAGSIYPLLGALEAEDLIAGRDEGDRRIYEITDKGRRLLEEHAADISQFVEDNEEEEEADGPAEQLREAAGRLMQAVSQLGPSSKRETIDSVRELLNQARKEIYELLAEE